MIKAVILFLIRFRFYLIMVINTQLYLGTCLSVIVSIRSQPLKCAPLNCAVILSCFTLLFIPVVFLKTV